MYEKIDHLVFACQNLEAGSTWIEEKLGVRAVPGGKHPGFGTANALIGLGQGTYLEIIGPDPDVKHSGLPAIFGIAQLSESKLATFALHESKLEHRLNKLREEGFDWGGIHPMSRETPSGDTLSWKLTNPMFLPPDGSFPFLIDWGDSPHPSASLPHLCHIKELSLYHPDVDRLKKVYALLDFPIHIFPSETVHLEARILCPKGEVLLK